MLLMDTKFWIILPDHEMINRLVEMLFVYSEEEWFRKYEVDLERY